MAISGARKDGARYTRLLTAGSGTMPLAEVHRLRWIADGYQHPIAPAVARQHLDSLRPTLGMHVAGTNSPTKRLVVSSVVKKKTADMAGLENGDLVLSWENHALDLEDFIEFWKGCKAGQDLAVRIQRQNQPASFTLAMTVGSEERALHEVQKLAYWASQPTQPAHLPSRPSQDSSAASKGARAHPAHESAPKSAAPPSLDDEDKALSHLRAGEAGAGGLQASSVVVSVNGEQQVPSPMSPSAASVMSSIHNSPITSPRAASRAVVARRQLRLWSPQVGFSLSPQGDSLRVSEVSPGLPAAAAGILVDDVLMSFGNRQLSNEADFSRAYRQLRVGDAVKVEICRDRQRREHVLVVGAREATLGQVIELKQAAAGRRVHLPGVLEQREPGPSLAWLSQPWAQARPEQAVALAEAGCQVKSYELRDHGQEAFTASKRLVFMRHTAEGPALLLDAQAFPLRRACAVVDGAQTFAFGKYVGEAQDSCCVSVLFSKQDMTRVSSLNAVFDELDDDCLNVEFPSPELAEEWTKAFLVLILSANGQPSVRFDRTMYDAVPEEGVKTPQPVVVKPTQSEIDEAREVYAGIKTEIGLSFCPAPAGPGIMVKDVKHNRAAEAAHLRPGHVIVTMNGTELRHKRCKEDFFRVWNGLRPGDVVDMSVKVWGRSDLFKTALVVGSKQHSAAEVARLRAILAFKGKPRLADDEPAKGDWIRNVTNFYNLFHAEGRDDVHEKFITSDAVCITPTQSLQGRPAILQADKALRGRMKRGTVQVECENAMVEPKDNSLEIDVVYKGELAKDGSAFEETSMCLFRFDEDGRIHDQWIGEECFPRRLPEARVRNRRVSIEMATKQAEARETAARALALQRAPVKEVRPIQAFEIPVLAERPSNEEILAARASLAGHPKSLGLTFNPKQAIIAGLRVRDIDESSSAYARGVRVGDIVQKINGHPITRAALADVWAEVHAGDVVELQVWESNFDLDDRHARPEDGTVVTKSVPVGATGLELREVLRLRQVADVALADAVDALDTEAAQPEPIPPQVAPGDGGGSKEPTDGSNQQATQAKAKPVVEKVVQDVMAIMMKGRSFCRYTADGKQAILLFFRDHCAEGGEQVLHWAAEGTAEELPGQGIPLKSIFALVEGKQTATLASAHARDALEECCFSIISGDSKAAEQEGAGYSAIHLEATSQKMRQTWVFGLLAMFMRAFPNSPRPAVYHAEQYLAPANEPEAVAPVAEEPEGLSVRARCRLQKGLVLQWYAMVRNVAKKRPVLVFHKPADSDSRGVKAGTLQWCLPGAPKVVPHCQIDLSAVTEIYFGKSTEVMQSKLAVEADSAHCASIVSTGKQLNFEAGSAQELKQWTLDVISLLRHYGIKPRLIDFPYD